MRLDECINALPQGKKISRIEHDHTITVSLFQFCCLCEIVYFDNVQVTKPWILDKKDLESEDWFILS